MKRILAIAAVVVLLVGCSSEESDPKPAATSARADASTTATPASTNTLAPAITNTPAPPAKPAWSAGGFALDEATVGGALGDADELFKSVDLGKPRTIEIEGGWITVTYKAEDALGETDLLTIGGRTSFGAHRKLFENPDVATVTVLVLGDWIDELGNTAEEVTTASTLERPTVAGINWNGLADRVELDNKHMFCVSDAWRVHLGIYSRLKDVGCLTSAIGF